MKRYHSGAERSMRAFWVIAALLSLAPKTQAQDASSRERALDLFVQAEERYAQGDLDGSIELLLEARTLHPEPVLLYNLARAYEGLGRFEEALEAYRQYLREDPSTRDRGAIEQRVVSLERELEERRRLEAARAEPAPSPAPAPPPSRDEGGSVVPWIVGGAGVAVLGAGVVVAVLAEGKRQDAIDDPVHETSRDAFRDAGDLATIANVLIVSGGVLAGVGLVWILADGDGEEEPRITAAIAPSFASVRGTFW